MRLIRSLLAAGVLLGAMLPRPSAAEIGTITLARQFGIAFIPFLMMENGKLIEKHAQALGLADLKVSWTVLTGAAPMNDALLSGQLSFGTGAAPALILLWDRTRTSANPIRGIAAIATMPTYLNTRNPAIHTLRDYTDKDRIALPSVKLSNAALVLQMAAAKIWGDGQYARLDPLTVSMGHPDAVAQVMGAGEITSHFASPPYHVLERRDPRVHQVIDSVEVMGEATLTDVWTTTTFMRDNPTVVHAVLAAMREAVDTINADKEAAADLYLRLSRDRIDRADLLTVLRDPHTIYSLTPLGTMAFAEFMHKTGSIRTKPARWTDMFFPIAHDLPGN